MAILDIIQGTPLWVWALLAYLIFIGIQALKPSTSPLYAIFIMPAVFLFLSLQGLLKNPTQANSIIWIISFIVGNYIGSKTVKRIHLQADKKKNLIRLPGTQATLFLVLSIFIIKYYFGYQLAVHPELLYDDNFTIMRLGIFASITGIAVGRAMQLYYKFQQASTTNLK